MALCSIRCKKQFLPLNKTLTYIAAYLIAAVFSGTLLCAAFPSFDQAVLAWCGMVPLLVVIIRANPLSVFLLSFACGAAFFLGLFNWIRIVPAYTPLHHLLLAVYLGSFFAVFGLVTAVIRRRAGVSTALWVAPFIWVPLEFLRSNSGFLALPWGLLGHTQYSSLWPLQLASVAGVYGISFLIVMVNAAIAGLFHIFLPMAFNRFSRAVDRTERRNITVFSVTTLCLLVAVLLSGRAVLNRPVDGKPIKLALVQGNIRQSEKWDPKNASAIMKVYSVLTRKAARTAPDLIVWPESATPRSIVVDRRILNQVQELAQEAGAHMLIGSSSLQKFNLKRPEKAKYVNSAFLIEPISGKRPDQRYDKIRLFPFGEYLPYKDRLPWSAIGVPIIDNYIAGRDFTLFKLSGVRIAVPICWENLFSGMVRKFARNGAQLIINLTNEAWFGDTTAPYQFLAMNVFRAVETGLYVVRCANTGISCIIDPRGRITGRVRDSDGKDVLVSGILSGEVAARDAVTVYYRYGDWLVWLCTAVASGILLVSLYRKKNSA
jgi:apolipoprotein N-acyltransferase